MYKLTLIIFFTHFFLLLFAQEQSKYALGYRCHYGFIVSHSPTMRYITQSNFTVHEVDFDRQTNGEKVWHVLYNYPNYGCTFIFSSLSKSRFFGHTAGLAPHLNFWVKNSLLFESVFKVGLGLSYTQKVYHSENNYKNTALATHVNALILLHFNQSFSLTPTLKITAGWGLTHYSNGNFKKPNRGINIITVNAGITYSLGKQQKMPLKIDTTFKKHVHCSIRLGGGLKEIYPPKGKKYFASTIGGYVNFVHSAKNTWFTGVDYFYDNSLIDDLNKDEFISDDFLLNHRTGVFVGYQLSIDKLAIEMGWGYYVWSKFKLHGTHYHRIGLRYNLVRGLFLNLSLKSHFANADYVEWGLGYNFKSW